MPKALPPQYVKLHTSKTVLLLTQQEYQRAVARGQALAHADTLRERAAIETERLHKKVWRYG